MNLKYLVPALLTIIGCCGKKSDSGGGGNNPPPPPPPPVTSDVAAWMTTGDQFNLFKKQNVALNWGTQANGNPVITVDESQKFQTVDGFGYTLTGGSADLLNGMIPAARTELLKELF